MSPPLLTLSIPFTLLGRLEILNPHSPTAEPPLSLVHKTLQHFCPSIPIHVFTPDTQPKQIPQNTEQSRTALGAGQTRKWLLRPAPRADAGVEEVDSARGWLQCAARLSDDEKRTLGGDLWACPLVLVRSGISVSRSGSGWAAFVAQARELCCVLMKAFVGFQGPMRGKNGIVKYWDVVFGKNSFLKVDVDLGDREVAKRIVMLMAAFEREMDLLRSTGEVVEVVGVSRWLEGVLLGKLAEERREASQRLGELRCGLDEAGWESSISAEEESYRVSKGREREWWDVVRDMDGDEMLKQMRRFEEHGLRLGVSMRSTRNETTQVTVQGQRSTLEFERLIAYVELISCFINTATRYNTAELTQRLEGFHHRRSAQHIDRFAEMLDFLTPDDQLLSKTLQAAFLSHLIPSTLPYIQPPRPPSAVDPFYRLRTYLEASYAETRKDMVEYMDRYDMAGGYMPTTNKKLCAMLALREERSRHAETEKRKG